MIDLHTHTTASDGRWAAAELVARAAAAGVRVLSVTDHDTMAGCEGADDACRRAGVEFVPGIEMTAVVDGADVHVLGYFVDRHSACLLAFLGEQRRRRLERVREIVARLAASGIILDADAILRPAIDDSTRTAGRPWIARALVAGGHVADSSEAFGRWLARGRPAFVPRSGAGPEEVIERIHDAGGLASLAHPALIGHDEWISGYASAGLDALEAYHSDHDGATTERYLALASRLALAVTGGSDYHGDDSHGPTRPGSVSLPRADYDRLVRLGAHAAPASRGRQRALSARWGGRERSGV